MIAPTDINAPVYQNLKWTVWPKDKMKHAMYRFFVKVTSNGGSTAYFGNYDLYVGCTPGSVTFTTNSSFVSNVAIFVGQNTTNVYQFAPP